MKKTLAGLCFCLAFIATSFTITPPASAACTSTLPTDKGQVSVTFTTASTATYAVWARMYVPANVQQDSVYMRIDDALCPSILGDTNKLTTNSLTWVRNQDGDPNKYATVTLTPGTHTLSIAGREAGAGIDSVMLITDNCEPTDKGDNCRQAVTVETKPDTPGAAPQTPGATASATKTAPQQTGIPTWIYATMGGTLLAVLGLGLFIAYKRNPTWWRTVLARIRGGHDV